MAIIDSTLREGCQTVGVAFSLRERLELVDDLLTIGVDEIELGVASPRNPELIELVAAIRERHGHRARLALWCRCRDEDIAWASQLDVDVLSLSIPVSGRLLAAKMGCSHGAALSRLMGSIRRAREFFPYVSIGFEDATRAGFEILDEFVDCAGETGASRVRLADTVGIGSPASVAGMVERVRGRSALAIGFHGHNDFGMATANAIAALEAGAAWVDATVLGLGERAGNARLEEVLAWLALARGMGRYELRCLRPLCQRLAGLTGHRVSRRQAVIGEDVFACETGLHLAALLKDPASYEPFAPETLGHERRLFFGAKSGHGAVAHVLRDAGLSMAEEGVEEVVRKLRNMVTPGAAPLSAFELPAFAMQGEELAVRHG